MRRKSFIVLLLALTALTPLLARDITVDDAIELAKQNNISIQSADIDIAAAVRTEKNAYFSLLPSVNVAASYSRSNQGTDYSSMMLPIMKNFNPSATKEDFIFGPYNSMAFSVQMSYNFNPAMVTALKVNPVNTELSRLEKEALEEETTANVKKLFYGLLLQRESIAVQEESLQAYADRYASTKEQYANGYAMELQVMQAEVTYENKKTEIETARRTMNQQEYSFKYLLGLPMDEEINLIGNLEFSTPEDEALTAGYTNSLAQLDKQLEMLNINKRSLQLQTYVPSISISASYAPTYSDITKNWADVYHDYGSVGVTVAFNLTNLLPSSTAHQNMKSVDDNIQKIALGKKAQQDANELTIVQSKENLMSIERSIEQSSYTIALAEKSLEATRLLYENGYSTLLDLRDAEDQVQLAKLSLLSQEYNYISALIDLERITGNRLI